MGTEERKMKTITATELKMNLGKYLALAEKEDIEVTRNGKPAVMISVPRAQKQDFEPVESVTELFGSIKGDFDIDEARWEYWREKCGY